MNIYPTFRQPLFQSHALKQPCFGSSTKLPAYQVLGNPSVSQLQAHVSEAVQWARSGLPEDTALVKSAICTGSSAFQVETIRALGQSNDPQCKLVAIEAFTGRCEVSWMGKNALEKFRARILKDLLYTGQEDFAADLLASVFTSHSTSSRDYDTLDGGYFVSNFGHDGNIDFCGKTLSKITPETYVQFVMSDYCWVLTAPHLAKGFELMDKPKQQKVLSLMSSKEERPILSAIYSSQRLAPFSRLGWIVAGQALPRILEIIQDPLFTDCRTELIQKIKDSTRPASMSTLTKALQAEGLSPCSR